MPFSIQTRQADGRSSFWGSLGAASPGESATTFTARISNEQGDGEAGKCFRARLAPLTRFLCSRGASLEDISIEIRTRLAFRGEEPSKQVGYAFTPVPSRITFFDANRQVLLRLMQTAKESDHAAAQLNGLIRTYGEAGYSFTMSGVMALFTQTLLHYNAMHSEHRWTGPQYFDEPNPTTLHIHVDHLVVNVARLISYATLNEQIAALRSRGSALAIDTEDLEFERFKLMKAFQANPCSRATFHDLRASQRAHARPVSFLDYYDWYQESLAHFELNDEGRATRMLESVQKRMEKAAKQCSQSNSTVQNLQEWISRNLAVHPLHQAIAIAMAKSTLVVDFQP